MGAAMLWLEVICDGILTAYRLGTRGDVWMKYAAGPLRITALSVAGELVSSPLMAYSDPYLHPVYAGVRLKGYVLLPLSCRPSCFCCASST